MDQAQRNRQSQALEEEPRRHQEEIQIRAVKNRDTIFPIAWFSERFANKEIGDIDFFIMKNVRVLIRICIFLALGLIIYWPTFHAPFCFDDEVIIVKNLPLQDPANSLSDLITRAWHFQPSRFLTVFSWALNYAASQLNPFSYHLVNWVIHLLTGAGVWVLGWLILSIRKDLKLNPDIAFWGALLFLVHPLNTEAVSYINQRSTCLSTLFYIWSIISYIEAGSSVQRQRRFVYFSFSGILGVLAVLSREAALTLPLAWVLVDYFILRRRMSKWPWIMLVCVTLFVGIGWYTFNIFLSPVESQSHRGDVLTLYTYLLTQCRVLLIFLKLIVLPVGLNIDYDFPMSHAFLEWPTLLAFVFLSMMAYCAFYYRKSQGLLSFAVSWFFVSLLSHIIPQRANVIAEHKLYLTLTVVVPLLCFWFCKKVPRSVFMVATAMFIAVFSFLTFERNKLWAEPLKLWENAVQQSPNKARCYLNLGAAYFQAGDMDKALSCYQKALSLAPEAYDAYTNISVIFYKQGNLIKAMDYVNIAIEVNPSSDVAYLQRAVILARQNKGEQAIIDLNKVLMLNPNQYNVYKTRGFLYERLGRQQEAIVDYDAWLKHYPRDEKVLSQEADLYFRQKNYSAALDNYNKLIYLSPKSVYYYNRSVLYQILGDQHHMSEDRKKAPVLGMGI